MLSQTLGTTGDDALFGRPGSGFSLCPYDSLAYADTWTYFLAVMQTFLQRAVTHGLRLNDAKCHLITTVAVWCGRQISRDGWNYAPIHVERLLTMIVPTKYQELSVLVHVSTLIKSTVPGLSAVHNTFHKCCYKLRLWSS